MYVSAHSSAVLVLVEMPRVRAEVESLLVRQGDSAKLTCVVSGLPLPHVFWYKDSIYLSSHHQKVSILIYSQLKLLVLNAEADYFTKI